MVGWIRPELEALPVALHRVGEAIPAHPASAAHWAIAVLTERSGSPRLGRCALFLSVAPSNPPWPVDGAPPPPSTAGAVVRKVRTFPLPSVQEEP